VTVAIINDNLDILEPLRDLLEREHYQVVTSRTRDAQGAEIDFVRFLREHDPRVVIWDIAAPYARQWARFTLVRSTRALDGRGVVLTTTHKGHLDELLGRDSEAFEIVGKPYDYQRIASAVKLAASRASDA
jgi:DNA-binding response OmpR family regulator